MSSSLLTELKQYDEAREGFPGEHWIVLAAGLGVWYLSAKHPSAGVKLVGLAAATALIGRAASGRDGLTKLLRYTPVGGALRGSVRHNPEVGRGRGTAPSSAALPEPAPRHAGTGSN